MENNKLVYLNIGELIISKDPVIVSTILGSCVSVCLYSTQEKIGGIIHYALPSKTYAHSDPRNEKDHDLLRFGDSAIPKLIDEICKYPGIQISELKAKVVGGGAVIDELKQSAQIGDLNIEMADRLLKQYRIPIVGKDVGGDSGRKVIFYTDTGRVRTSPLKDRPPFTR